MSKEKILREYKNVAVVGLSDNPERASHRVAAYLQQHGYHIIPVNPKAAKILGRQSYPDLAAVPEKVEIVDIFRRAEEVMPIVEAAIKIGARAVWMQEGIVNEAAAAKARPAGLEVVMDRCMLKEHARLMPAD